MTQTAAIESTETRHQRIAAELASRSAELAADIGQRIGLSDLPEDRRTRSEALIAEYVRQTPNPGNQAALTSMSPVTYGGLRPDFAEQVSNNILANFNRRRRVDTNATERLCRALLAI